jgi:exopolyphosphatase
MNSLNNYLAAARVNLADTRLVVMGNEAADLDSMASSIAYGLLCSLLSPPVAALPVMPIPRADFILRTEAVYMFQEAGISLEELLFLDEVDLDSLLNRAQLMLVDHNQLSSGLEKFADRVSGILDHHKDEGLFADADPRIIQTIGSTASLVAMEFCKKKIPVPAEVATLLTGTILLDTVNLDDEAGRVTEADMNVAALLLPICPLLREDLFSRVQEAKFNVQGLTTVDLLRKDYKEWQLGKMRCGIGSALLPVADWCAMDNDLAAGFAAYADQQQLDLLLSMNAYTSPDFQRDLIIFSPTEERLQQLVQFLNDKDLDLRPVSCPDQLPAANGFIGLYSQGNLAVSRKKLQPLLADFSAKG